GEGGFDALGNAENRPRIEQSDRRALGDATGHHLTNRTDVGLLAVQREVGPVDIRRRSVWGKDLRGHRRVPTLAPIIIDILRLVDFLQPPAIDRLADATANEPGIHEIPSDNGLSAIP